MPHPVLLPDLLAHSAERYPGRAALTYGNQTFDYARLGSDVRRFASGLIDRTSLSRGDRVAIYLEKRPETVIASFGTMAASGVFVPINPLLKADQVSHILRDCNVRVLVTSAERWASLTEALSACPDLRHIVLVNEPPTRIDQTQQTLLGWNALLDAPSRSAHRIIDADMAAIFYTSGSTGKPKGVMLSHRNLVVGAQSVASYLENSENDTLLAALPLSFDAGFSQLTTAFLAGARVVLLNYLMPQDVIKTLDREHITGLTAVPPLYIQLVQQPWPADAGKSLRYFANTGGKMPRSTLDTLRARLPKAKPYLMYGLTEAFRSTYLSPDEVDRRPDSIGKAIPNAEILVLKEDGTHCTANEPGELVHRGALVGMGYWNDPETTAQRFKSLPPNVRGSMHGLVLPEIAVFSGDTVKQDEDGFLYFVGRRDEMIKTSGYRTSPAEVEEILYGTGMVSECVAFGIDHETLGQAIQVIATPSETDVLDTQRLLEECRKRMPAYMVPHGIDVRSGPLPRNPNGKLDRKALAAEWVQQHVSGQRT